MALFKNVKPGELNQDLRAYIMLVIEYMSDEEIISDNNSLDWSKGLLNFKDNGPNVATDDIISNLALFILRAAGCDIEKIELFHIPLLSGSSLKAEIVYKINENYFLLYVGSDITKTKFLAKTYYLGDNYEKPDTEICLSEYECPLKEITKGDEIIRYLEDHNED